LKELISIFTAKENLPSMKIKDYRIENDLFIIESVKQGDNFTISIDPEIGHITRVEINNEEGDNLTREYSNFVKDESLYFPRKIDMVRPVKKQSISIFYTQFTLNQKINPARFIVKISDNAEQMNYIH